MRLFILLAVSLLWLHSCQSDKASTTSNTSDLQSKRNSQDSVKVQPIDVNNTLFMMHYQITSMLDSTFYAPPQEMKNVYEHFMFEIKIIIADVKNMNFQFKGADSFTDSALKLFEKIEHLMREDYPPIMSILVSDEINDQEQKKIQAFEENFDQEIKPLTQRFFKAQKQFADIHKIELVEY